MPDIVDEILSPAADKTAASSTLARTASVARDTTVALAAGDDYAANTGTSGTLTVGGSATGTIETYNDRDWFRITLTAGQYYEFTQTGIGIDKLTDTYLRIYNQNGTLIAQNDDANGFFSAVTIEANYTGTYYVAAGAYVDNLTHLTGDYRVRATTTEAPTPVSSIQWGDASLSGTTINVYFAPNGTSVNMNASWGDVIISEGANAYEISRFRAAFDMIESVIDVDFNIVTDRAQADLTITIDTDQITDGTLGYFNPPGEANAGIGLFNAAEWDRTAGGDLEAGGYSFVTITHELLHGMGLAHPHDDGGGSDIMQGVEETFGDYGDFALNQGIYTTMSYNSGWERDWEPPNHNFGYEAGPMALDIAALQEKYGAAVHNTGGTTYVLDNSNGSGTHWEAIWDTGGNDIIVYNGTRGATINLNAATLEYEAGGGGFVSWARGIYGGFTIANGVVIERARGGSGNDMITGNAVGNILQGNGGSDRINGGDGIDVLSGGGGTDVLNGGAGNDRLDSNTGIDTMTGGGGADLFLFSVTGRDTITDFASGVDRIDLSAFDAISATAGSDDAFTFIGTTAFSGNAGELRFAAASHLVQADWNGDGAADFVLTLTGVSGLVERDFVL